MNTKRLAFQIFLIFLRLGFTAFGGPVAHLAFFREEFVKRKNWLTESEYSEIVALCQFLPGPASSQVGLTIGLTRAGYLGSVAAWLGFTMPSAILLTVIALAYTHFNNIVPSGFLLGLKIVVVAVVAQAVWGMAMSICTDTKRITIMLLSATVLFNLQYTFLPLLLIVVAGIFGMLLFKSEPSHSNSRMLITLSRREGYFWMSTFFILLAGLPLVELFAQQPLISIASSFFRTGSLVFGGGHVVLPLLEAEVVQTGLVTKEAFLVGYGATQAMPGPLFTFSAFLGALLNGPISGILGALIALFAIFMPSFLLVYGVLPFWQMLRQNSRIKAALIGINACVVGILLSALYQPVFVSAVSHISDFIGVVVAFFALTLWKLPPWLVVILGGLLGAVLL